MSVHDATGGPPRARLELTTWTYDSEPPAAVDSDLDRRADRSCTAAQVFFWTAAGLFVLAVLLVLFGVPMLPMVLVAGALLGFATAVALGLWHQRLRWRTGVPVIVAMEDIVQPGAEVLAADAVMFRRALDEEHVEGLDAAQVRQRQEVARQKLAEHRRLARTVINYAELAAQADRRGWKWLRDRHMRSLALAIMRTCGGLENSGTAGEDAVDPG